jgi:hypothetical protein
MAQLFHLCCSPVTRCSFGLLLAYPSKAILGIGNALRFPQQCMPFLEGGCMIEHTIVEDQVIDMMCSVHSCDLEDVTPHLTWNQMFLADRLSRNGEIVLAHKGRGTYVAMFPLREEGRLNTPTQGGGTQAGVNRSDDLLSLLRSR